MDDLGLDYGPGDKSPAAIYARYAMGTPIRAIAEDAGLTIHQVYHILRRQPEEYAKSRKERDDFTDLRIQRALSLLDNLNLKSLEKVTEKENVTDKEITDINTIGDGLAKRVALSKGQATEIIRDDTKKPTIEDIRIQIKQVDDAGNGLATE